MTASGPLEALWRREEGVCYLCLLPCPLEHATREHVVARSEGGRGGANLRLAHSWCNHDKGTTTAFPLVQTGRERALRAIVGGWSTLTWFSPVDRAAIPGYAREAAHLARRRRRAERRAPRAAGRTGGRSLPPIGPGGGGRTIVGSPGLAGRREAERPQTAEVQTARGAPRAPRKLTGRLDPGPPGG